MSRSEATVPVARKSERKKAGRACAGAVSGLTRSRMITREVMERRAASERPKRREVIVRVRIRVRVRG